MRQHTSKRYACVKQHDVTDCGAACLATVSKHYGLTTQVSKIRERAGTDKQGTSVYGITKAAEELGFMAKAFKATKESLLDSELPLPAIAHIVVDGKLLHYVVIHDITTDKVIVADPGKGIVPYSMDAFCETWTGVLILMIPTPEFTRGNETKGLFSRFLHLIVPQKRVLLGVFFTSLLYTLFGIAGTFYFMYLIDSILPNQSDSALQIVSIAAIVLIVCKVLLHLFRNQLLLHLSNKLDIDLMLGYYRHVLRLPMNFFGTRRIGEITSRLTDASKVRDAISAATLTIMIDTLMAIGGAAILYYQNVLLFGVSLSLIPLYLVIAWKFHKPYEDTNRQQMESNSLLTSYMVESIRGIETIKAYRAEDKSVQETEKKFHELLKHVWKLGLLRKHDKLSR